MFYKLQHFFDCLPYNSYQKRFIRKRSNGKGVADGRMPIKENTNEKKQTLFEEKNLKRKLIV